MKLAVIGGAITIAALVPAVAAASFDHDLHYGMRHNPDVAALQRFLSDQGDYDGPINGSFLLGTKEGLGLFQEDQHIRPARGYFGKLTRARINTMLDDGTDASTSSTTDFSQLDGEIGDLSDRFALIEQEVQDLSNTVGLLNGQSSNAAIDSTGTGGVSSTISSTPTTSTTSTAPAKHNGK